MAEEGDDWDFETDARYFMGYFWWHYKKRGSLVETWWVFFGPQIRRDWLTRFFYSIGVAIGAMIARVFIVPDYMLNHYTLNYGGSK